MVDGFLLGASILGATAATCAAMAGWQAAWVRWRWRRAARSLELPLHFPLGGVPVIEGDHLGMRVCVTGDSVMPARVSVTAPAGIYVGPARGKREPDEGTGDAIFDAAVVVHAEDREDWVAARLDRETRDHLLFFVRHGGTLNLGYAEISGSRPEGKRSIELAAARAIRVSWSASEPIDVPECLATSSREDPELQVRERCLKLLCERFPDQAWDACRDALLDPNPGVRLLASVFLRTEGLPSLLQLATDAKVPEDIASKAIAHTAAMYNDDTREAVEETLACAFVGAPLIQAQAIHSAAKIGWWDGLDSRIELMQHLTPLGRTALAKSLTRFPDHLAESEKALVQMLADTDPMVKRTAAASLGEIGTIAAVEPLLPLSQSRLDPETKRIATDSIRRIQGRQVGAGAGQLTFEADLVHAEEGQLELASEAGELALANEAGELALVQDPGAAPPWETADRAVAPGEGMPVPLTPADQTPPRGTPLSSAEETPPRGDAAPALAAAVKKTTA